ncbi:hypothetical protein MTO96_042909 [Rhipicephalus appendiculatus]
MLSTSFAEHRDNVLVENTVPAQEARVNAAPQVPSVLEPTFIRLPEGSASETELSGAEEHRDNVLVDNAVPVQEARANEARQAALPQAPSAAQTPTINSVTGVAAEVLSQVPCTSHRDVRRKTKELKAKLRKQRDLNRRLQARLQRQRQALTLGEVVRSVRSHVSPAVAALVEAQLRMNNVSRFGRRWSSQNKSFALGLYFHSPKGYRYCRRLLRLPSVRSLQLWLKRVPLRVGFFPQIFDLIKRRAATFSMSDRACCIVFDEMHIKRELSYNPSHDRFEGLEEYDGVQGNNLCNKALVFMAKGAQEKNSEVTLNENHVEKVGLLEDILTRGILKSSLMAVDALELGQHQESLVDQEIDLFGEGEVQNTVIGSPRDDGKYYAGSDRWVDKESWDLLMKAPTDSMFCRSAAMLYWSPEQLRNGSPLWEMADPDRNDVEGDSVNESDRTRELMLEMKLRLELEKMRSSRASSEEPENRNQPIGIGRCLMVMLRDRGEFVTTQDLSKMQSKAKLTMRRDRGPVES